jgi:hypothetical protein
MNDSYSFAEGRTQSLPIRFQKETDSFSAGKIEKGT